ncbi:sensor histidine kinase [Streptomyces sp. GESEQ-35]|uniref:sensor histidine kinase n=1 Tax=Streptomyces sp. GESEQ-35 TaxID=2812657 RepID=UPI001B326566|nr:sensor histidine kinase [Streptomyces sp. GESEQ-35]
MSWLRKTSCRMDAWQLAYQHTQESQPYENGAERKPGQLPANPGPPPTGFSLLPWLLLGMGALSNLFQDETPNPWIGGLGLLTFNSLYIYVTFRAFGKRTREATSTRVALVLLGLVTCALAFGYGGTWVLFFPLLGLATGAVVRMPHLRWAGTAVAVLAGVASVIRDGWGGLDTAYATWISTMVTAAILSLSEAVRELRAAREELARRAVEEERLRFSRDLHDLLGHTLSVIVVKSEAARRLAARDIDAALLQITDIESVGRQVLTEIREAVTGYREGSLTTDLDRARSALTAAGMDSTVHRSGPPLPPQTEALLGWVVREAVTNVVRHSDAGRCEITVSGATERVRLTVTDDGTGTGTGDLCAGVGGTGLKGLTERLAKAGGSLTAGPGTRGGFVVTAELPVDVSAARLPIAVGQLA